LDRWSVTALASYTRLLDDAADSPIVDDAGDANQFFGGALINYRF
jgi:outer membrane protein